MNNIEQTAYLLQKEGLASYKKGDYSAAEQQFVALLKIFPDHIDTLYNLALALKAQGKTSEAVASLLAILEVEPEHTRANFLLGKYLLEKNFPKDAENYFAIASESQIANVDVQKNIFLCLLEYRALAAAKHYAEKILGLEPHNLDIRYNLALIHSQFRQLTQAVQQYKKILELNPHYFPALNNLAVLYVEQNDLIKASYYAKLALAEQPDNVALRYTLEAIEGKSQCSAPPKEYIEQLFDQYAEHYDKHLIVALEYQVPAHLKQILISHNLVKENSLSILDVGCGTGLAGAVFRDVANNLIGVDISSKMLAEAQKKNIYDELFCLDFIEFLSSTQQSYDLILAADVLVYLGDLSAFLQSCKKVLAKKGLLLFSVELNDSNGYQQEKSGRFSHGKNYIENLSQQFHFLIDAFEIIPTRIQHHNMVKGAAFLLKNS